MLLIGAGSVASVLLGTMIYISLQFKFGNKSLENLNNLEILTFREKKNSIFQTNSIHVEIPNIPTFTFLLQMVNHFNRQAKHRSPNVLTNPSTQTQPSLLLTA
jgi:hypothetical protein